MDKIQRFIFEKAQVRGQLVHLTESFQTIIDQHQYPPLISQLLGQVLAVSTLLSAIIKFKGRLTVQFQGKNPLKLVLAQCNNAFQIRGLVQWTGDLSQSELLAALTHGTLAIMISSDTNVTPYQGIVSWQGDSIATSIEGYFKDSEQLPTRIWLAVNNTTAAGLLLQVLPEDSSIGAQPIVESSDWERIVMMAATLKPEELLNLENENLLHRLYSQDEVRLFEPSSVTFFCNCSVARSEQAILMLGEEEANEELRDKQKIVVTCEFCNREYEFDRVDVANIFKKPSQPPLDHLH